MLEESQRRNWNPLPLSRGPSVSAVALGHAHISRKDLLSMSYEKRRAISGAHSAFFDFAQNEEEFDMPSTAYLILSEVEGRTTPMQCSKMCACPSAVAAGAAKPRREQAGEGEARVLARAITCISPAFARRRRIAVLLSTGESPTPSYNRPPALCLLFTGGAKENYAIYPRLATRRPSGVSLQISQSGLSGLENHGSAQPRSTQVLTVRGLTRWPLRSNSGSLPPGWSRPRASQARCAAFGGPDGGAPTSFNAPRFIVPLVMPHPSWLTAFPGNATAMLCLADPRAKPAATMQARQGSPAGARRRLPCRIAGGSLTRPRHG